ncbi:MAG TPA: malate dehydrogenase [Candidatus Polarisedimenticolia bacterium]|nr:malate dehydrogenase [Candidatus Polarisedimenticolia bacterium]
MRKKVSIIGAGHVGASAAERIAMRRLGDVVLVDIIEGLPQGKSLDLNEAGPVDGYDVHITGSNGYDETEGSDVVVITSGLPRKPGMSRDDLLQKNFDIVKSVTEQVARRSPRAVLIVVSNPLDAMAHTALKVSRFPRERVLGMAGVLDSARMRFFMAEALGVSVEDTHAFVLGGHGDSMVPLPRYSTVAGIPLPDLLPKERIDAIVKRTRDGGIEVVNLLKSGSAYYAPASAIVQMTEAILLDRKRILPCAVFLQGEYGYKDLFLGVPARLGAGGMEKVIEIRLGPEEKAALDKSAQAVRELIAKLSL